MIDAIIRPAEEKDARLIARVHVRSFQSNYQHLPTTRKSALNGEAARVRLWESRLVEQDRRTLVAVNEDRLAGFIHLGPSPDPDATDTTGHIFSVHVDPAITGHGFGRRLVEEATAELVSMGFSSATLWALKDNEQVHGFYERLGWKRDGQIREEVLAVGSEEGDVVTVVRFWLDLSGLETQR